MRLPGLLLAFALCVQADFQAAQWTHRQRIQSAATLSRLTLNAAVFDHAAPSLADLRIIDGQNNELPYILQTAAGATRSVSIPARLVNRESRNGTTSATLEFDGRQLHNSLALSTTREELHAKVRIESSNDGAAWATIRESAYIFRYRNDEGRLVEHLSLNYADSRRRFVRLTLSDWPDAASLTGIQTQFEETTAPRRAELHQVDAPAAKRQGKSDCTELTRLNAAPRNHAAFVPASPAVFHRGVTLEESRDGKSWTWLAAGPLYRTATDSSLSIEHRESSAPRLRICVHQGDDAPLRFARIGLSGINRELTFRFRDADQVANPRAISPTYDLAQTTNLAGTQPATLALAQANPAYQPPAKPWAEQSPGLLYAIMAVAIAGLGWFALRLLRAA
jgi:hypothetical protein